MISWLSEHDWTWWINELGILLEIVGAIIVVIAAFESQAEIKHVKDTWDAELPTKLRDIIATQAFTELRGFGLLAVGLLCQFGAGFR